jgi:hypothetical protein
MQRTLAVLALAGMAAGLGGCGLYQDVQSISQDLTKKDDSDFIASGAPLTMPPDYSLRPPSSSTSATSGQSTARQAQVILKTDVRTGAGTAAPQREGGLTAGEREVLARAGYSGTTSDVVRKTLDIESQRRGSGDTKFTDRILKYDPNAKPASSDDAGARDATGDRPVIKRPGEF